jgi:PAS domain-containing protein
VILEANDRFLQIVGYDREDLVSGRMRWTDMTPPDWLDLDKRCWVPELKMRGSLQPYEEEYFRKVGSRVKRLRIDRWLNKITINTVEIAPIRIYARALQSLVARSLGLVLRRATTL